MVGREVSRRLNVEFGVVDLSLAPTPEIGDSVAAILEAMGTPELWYSWDHSSSCTSQ